MDILLVRFHRDAVEIVSQTVVDVADDHGDDAGDGDGEQRAEEATELDADQGADEDRQGVQADRPRLHGGLEDVVLDLLVDDEEDDGNDAGRRGVQERDHNHDRRSEQCSDERDQVRQSDPEG